MTAYILKDFPQNGEKVEVFSIGDLVYVPVAFNVTNACISLTDSKGAEYNSKSSPKEHRLGFRCFNLDKAIPKGYSFHGEITVGDRTYEVQGEAKQVFPNFIEAEGNKRSHGEKTSRKATLWYVLALIVLVIALGVGVGTGGITAEGASNLFNPFKIFSKGFGGEEITGTKGNEGNANGSIGDEKTANTTISTEGHNPDKTDNGNSEQPAVVDFSYPTGTPQLQKPENETPATPGQPATVTLTNDLQPETGEKKAESRPLPKTKPEPRQTEARQAEAPQVTQTAQPPPQPPQQPQQQLQPQIAKNEPQSPQQPQPPPQQLQQPQQQLQPQIAKNEPQSPQQQIAKTEPQSPQQQIAKNEPQSPQQPQQPQIVENEPPQPQPFTSQRRPGNGGISARRPGYPSLDEVAETESNGTYVISNESDINALSKISNGGNENVVLIFCPDRYSSVITQRKYNGLWNKMTHNVNALNIKEIQVLVPVKKGLSSPDARLLDAVRSKNITVNLMDNQ